MTAPTPADEFSAILIGQLTGTEPTGEPEPSPRLPAPNYAQGTSDGGLGFVDPAQLFAQALLESVGRGASGNRGGWVELHPHAY